MEHVLLSHFLSELPQLWSLDNLLVLILLIEFHQLLESTLPCMHGNGDLQGLIVELISAQEYVDGDSELLTCDKKYLCQIWGSQMRRHKLMKSRRQQPK